MQPLPIFTTREASTRVNSQRRGDSIPPMRHFRQIALKKWNPTTLLLSRATTTLYYHQQQQRAAIHVPPRPFFAHIITFQPTCGQVRLSVFFFKALSYVLLPDILLLLTRPNPLFLSHFLAIQQNARIFVISSDPVNFMIVYYPCIKICSNVPTSRMNHRMLPIYNAWYHWKCVPWISWTLVTFHRPWDCIVIARSIGSPCILIGNRVLCMIVLF